MFKLIKNIMLFKISDYKINYSRLNPRNWKRPSIKKILKNTAWIIIFLGAFIIVKDELAWQFDDYGWDDYGYEDYIDEEECNVLGVEVYGDIYTYQEDPEYTIKEAISEDITFLIELGEKKSKYKAILLEVDSYGGSAVAGEEIAMALKKAKKPTVVLVRGGAVSAGYLVASGADKIYASRFSDIGSIGATMSYLDYNIKNQREGINYVSISSGKFKDTGDPNKFLSAEEKALLQRDIDIMHDYFVELVVANRGLDIEEVKKMADGSTMLGAMALEHGLIDQIGSRFDAEEYLKEIIGEEVDICW